jgi:hypothetical protein
MSVLAPFDENCARDAWGRGISMRQLSTASAAIMMPTRGSNAARTAPSPRILFSSPQASNGTDAILAIAVVVAAWVVALCGVGYLSHLAG